MFLFLYLDVVCRDATDCVGVEAKLGCGRANQFLTQISRSICSEVFGRRQANGTCWFNQKRVFGRHHENIWLDTGGMFLMIGNQKSLQTSVLVAGFKPGWWWDGVKVRKLKEMCLERRVIGDRCDRYGRSGVRGIRRGKAKPTKLGSAWTTRREHRKYPPGTTGHEGNPDFGCSTTHSRFPSRDNFISLTLQSSVKVPYKPRQYYYYDLLGIIASY